MKNNLSPKYRCACCKVIFNFNVLQAGRYYLCSKCNKKIQKKFSSELKKGNLLDAAIPFAGKNKISVEAAVNIKCGISSLEDEKRNKKKKLDSLDIMDSYKMLPGHFGG